MFHLVENLVCGELHQLPTVRSKLIFTLNDAEIMERYISMDLWCKFRLAEIDQVMYQDDE